MILRCVHGCGGLILFSLSSRSPLLLSSPNVQALEPLLTRFPLSQVEAEILEELRGPKIIVYKMKPKKTYRRKNGHRQELTKFQVTSISA